MEREGSYTPMHSYRTVPAAVDPDIRWEVLSKDVVLRWMCESDEDDVAAVLYSLSKKRPDVLNLQRLGSIGDIGDNSSRRSCIEPGRRSSIRSSVAFGNSDTRPKLAKRCSIASLIDEQLDDGPKGDDSSNVKEQLLVANGDDACADILPVLQFSSPMYFVEEAEEEVELDVFRIGSRKGYSAASYKTVDASAHAGEFFVATSGIVEFQAEEWRKTIKVHICNNESWNTTTEFKLMLTDEKLSGATLGQYLFQTRVKIIDKDTFPTNELSSFDLVNDSGSVPKVQLLLEYCRMTWHSTGIRSATAKTILADLFSNIQYTIELFMSVYLYDFVLDRNESTSSLLFIHHRRPSLVAIGLIHLFLLLVSHFLCISEIRFGMAGKAKYSLQTALLRKFLNYEKSARARVEAGELVMAVDRDIEKMVLDGYGGCVRLIREVGQLFCMIIFFISSPYVFRHKPRSADLLSLAGVPVLLAGFLFARTNIVARHLKEDNSSDTKVADFLSSTYANFNLLLDYSLRNIASDKFAKLVEHHNSCRKIALETLAHNKYFARWVAEVIVAGYILFAGSLVLQGHVTIGMFIVNLGIFKQVGVACEEIFAILSEMQATIPSLSIVARLLNFPTDLITRQNLKRSQTQITKQTLIERKNGAAVDDLPIVFDFNHYHFNDLNVNLSGRTEISQGRLVALVGDTGSGKATLLRLISGAILPGFASGSSIYIPAHLRIVNVAEVPLFFPGTLIENLAFGVPHSHSDAAIERIEEVCRLLGVDPRAMEYLSGEKAEEEERWIETFSFGQCKLLMIARALVNNAELMCFHRPFVSLDQIQTPTAMDLFLQHVKEKGIVQKSDMRLRRMRTIIMTSGKSVAVEKAHEIIRLSRTKGLEKITKEEVEENDLRRSSFDAGWSQPVDQYQGSGAVLL